LRSDKKYEPETANLKFITASEVVIIYPLSIDVCAVQTSDVANAPALSPAADLCVSATHCDVIKKEICFWCPPDGDDVFGCIEGKFSALAWTAMYHQHC